MYDFDRIIEKLETNIEIIKEDLGIIFPKNCQNEKERCEYEIKYRYEKILNRPKNLNQPKIKFTVDEDRIEGILKDRGLYKCIEIVSKYEIPPDCEYWNNTEDLIDKIIEYQIYIYSLSVISKKEKKNKPNQILVETTVTSTKTSGVYSEYEVISEIKNNDNIFLHPSKVVEAETLFNISLPPLTEEFKKIVKERNWFGLSKLQTETVIYACFSHENFLSNGERRGYLIGDGTGIGKGRELCGIISYNYDSNRKKSLWFTVSNSLIVSTRRDIKDTRENNDIQVFTLPTSCDAQINEKSGILFMTYKKLVSNGSRKTERNRFDQICEWLGEDFDGVIVFDECHSAKSFSEKKSSKTGKIVYEIQRLYKNARVVYSSASSASEIKNLGYMGRLGIWDQSFSNSFETFKKCLNSGGVGAIELLSCELKRRGCFCARNLSYDGVEFEAIELNISPEEEENYAQYSQLWYDMLKLSDKKLKMMYWGAHQRFFMHYILTLKIKKCIEIVQDALLNNNCAIIGLFSTGENSIKRCKDDEFSSLKDVAENFAKKLNNKSIMERITKLKFPQNPIDELIHKLGGEKNVAEISGRNVRIAKVNGKNVLQKRNSERDNLKETDDFQSGKKSIAIITEAASLGISLHDQGEIIKRRIHVILQLPWSADKALQQLGRSHRSNESSAPFYKIIFTKIAGEKRLVSTMANRLKVLGAITNGDRRASPNSALFSGQILCPEISKIAISKLDSIKNLPNEIQDNIYTKKCIKNFLNKLLGAEPSLQETIFNEFLQNYDNELEESKSKGMKLQDLQFLDEEPIKNQILYTPDDGLTETRILTYEGKGCVIVGTVLPFVQEIIETLGSMKRYDNSIYRGLQIVFVLVEGKWMVGTLFSSNLKKTLVNCLSRKVELSIKEKYKFLGSEILSLLESKILKSQLNYKELSNGKEVLKNQLYLFSKELEIQIGVLKEFFTKYNFKMDSEKEQRIRRNRKINKLKRNYLYQSIKSDSEFLEILNNDLPSGIAEHMKIYYPVQILS